MKRMLAVLLALMLCLPAACADGDETPTVQDTITSNLDILFADEPNGPACSELLLAWLTDHLGQPDAVESASVADAALVYQSETGVATLCADGLCFTWQGVEAAQGMRLFTMACNEWAVLSDALRTGEGLRISYCHPDMVDGGMHVADADVALAYAQALQMRGVQCSGAGLEQVAHRYCQDPAACHHRGQHGNGAAEAAASASVCPYCEGAGSHRASCGNCDGSGAHRCSSCNGDGRRQCGTCHGSGKHKGHSSGHHSSSRHCGTCNGSGQRTCGSCSGAGHRTCGTCGGNGYRSNTCTWCQGTGWCQ